MIDMKPMDSIKLDIFKLDKSETCQEENMLSEDTLYRFLYQPSEQHGDHKDELLTLSRAKIHIGKTEL